MEEAELITWLIAEGAPVKKDLPIFELETDKAIVEVPSPADGVLLKIVTQSGLVRVDDVVGWVGLEGETIDPFTPPPAREITSPAAAPTIPTVGDIAAEGRIRATPAARRVAAERGIDLGTVMGTGPEGRITQQDIERAVASPKIRSKTLVKKLITTWHTVPHIHVARKISVDALEQRHLAMRPMGTSITDLLLQTLAKVLPKYPELTSFWDGDSLRLAKDLSIAFAVDTDRGVVAPVIRSASKRDIADITKERKRLTEAARAARLNPSDLESGVFTLTNLGMAGADFFAPIVNHPQVAILAAGRILREPVVKENQIVVGARMWLNLALDHRVADGVVAGRFLVDLETNLAGLPAE